MRKHIARFLQWLLRRVVARPVRSAEEQARIDTIRTQARLLNEAAEREADYRRDYIERAAELIEARQMAGAGPWLAFESRASAAAGDVNIRESNPITSQGAFGDIELALQNVEWRREINLSWLEFSRWGIQQIILISRLYYIKNPLVRRLINISSSYVFGRGVEVSSDDDTANAVLTDFFTRNKSSLGQIALVELEKRKYYDGNLFFAFFADTNDKGITTVRNIDATEIQDIITDPDDTDQPMFYRREWTQRVFNQENGTVESTTQKAWYPALSYIDQAKTKPKTIGGVAVRWETPILHRKAGGVAKWHFGCPMIYPAIDWAKASKKFLEDCATVKNALAQIAMKIKTKGGQQAIEGIKQQMQTQVGPTSSLWDQNPNAVAGSVFASGPGTELEVFNTKGGGGDPEEVRQFKLMCCIVVGVPETFLGDVKTGNLATAASLDRPTELVFMERQEEWREDLVTIAQYVLNVSKKAPSGKIREALEKVKMSPADITHFVIREADREQRRTADGSIVWAYVAEAKKADNTIQVRATFPAIREGDLKIQVDALVESMTLGDKTGAIHGIDEKEGIRRLYELNGYENSDELVELQYPEDEYDPDRTAEPEPAPAPQPAPGVPAAPQRTGAPHDTQEPQIPEPTPRQREAARRLVREALRDA